MENDTYRYDRLFLLIGVVLNSLAYIGMVFVLGVIMGNKPAALLAIATAGTTYLGFVCQLAPAPRIVSIAAVGLSVAVGAAAGIALLI